MPQNQDSLPTRQGWVTFKEVVLRQGWWAGGEDKEGGSNHKGIRQNKVSRKVIIPVFS